MLSESLRMTWMIGNENFPSVRSSQKLLFSLYCCEKSKSEKWVKFHSLTYLTYAKKCNQKIICNELIHFLPLPRVSWHSHLWFGKTRRVYPVMERSYWNLIQEDTWINVIKTGVEKSEWRFIWKLSGFVTRKGNSQLSTMCLLPHLENSWTTSGNKPSNKEKRN